MGSFPLPEGLFQRAAKHHLHGRHCVAYIFERQSQKSTLLTICSDTPAQLQSDECNDIAKLNITRDYQVLVLSDKRHYRNLTFHNVLPRQGSSYCDRVCLTFQSFALRGMKITSREGCRVGQKMSYHFSFC